ncbi:MAG: hypothetical protein E7I48_18680, partial [Clostridium celatum]|nr:hypothetical protein [Clostridium celatum]
MFKKFITVSLATALLTSSLSFISVYAATPQDTINENLQKYQTLDNQILELNSKIQALDVEIDQTTIKLNENNTAIADIEDQIKTNEAKLEQTKEDIENSQVVLDNRVRTMYKTNMTSNILVSIITSKSVSELFSKVQAISKIISTDKEVLATINEKKSELDSTIESLNNKNSELVVLKKTIEEDLKTVESKKAEQEQYVEQLNSEKESVFSVIEENEKLLISKPLSIANSSSASASELQNAIDTLNSYIPLLNSSTTINMAKNGISNAKARIDELNTPTVPTTGTEVGTAIK